MYTMAHVAAVGDAQFRRGSGLVMVFEDSSLSACGSLKKVRIHIMCT